MARVPDKQDNEVSKGQHFDPSSASQRRDVLRLPLGPPRKRRRLARSSKEAENAAPTICATATIEVAFDELGILLQCMHRIHHFSPGTTGRELVADGDRCVSLGHWSLITSAKAGRSTLSVSSLLAACRAGRMDVIESLVSHYGLDVNARAIGGWTPLHTAMCCRDETVCSGLLAMGAKDSATDDGVHASSLHPEQWHRVSGQDSDAADTWKVPTNALDAVTQLVEMIASKPEGAPVDALCRRVCASVRKLGLAVFRIVTTRYIEITDEGWPRRWTLLAAVATTGSCSLCTLCLELGAAVDRADASGKVALFMACAFGHIDCARLFLDRGAEVNKQTNLGQTALHVASGRGYLDSVRLLLQRGAEIERTDRDGDTPLHAACRFKHVDCVRFLLDAGADAHRQFCHAYMTPLYLACGSGSVDCARLLLDRGAKVNSTCERYRERSPLHAACGAGSLECTCLLLDCGAAVNKRDVDGATPLHKACGRRGSLECVRLLLTRQADVEKVDGERWSPLFWACKWNRRDVAALLLEGGANPAATAWEQTPSSIASRYIVHGSGPDPELAEMMKLAQRDRATAIKRLYQMDAYGPR